MKGHTVFCIIIVLIIVYQDVVLYYIRHGMVCLVHSFEVLNHLAIYLLQGKKKKKSWLDKAQWNNNKIMYTTTTNNGEQKSSHLLLKKLDFTVIFTSLEWYCYFEGLMYKPLSKCVWGKHKYFNDIFCFVFCMTSKHKSDSYAQTATQVLN